MKRDFGKKLLEKLFFTDETQKQLGSFTHDSIRLSEENETKLKEGNEEILNMIKRPEKKFEKSLMIAGGSSFYGLSVLILCEGTVNEFSYGQALIIYKEESAKLNKNLIFE